MGLDDVAARVVTVLTRAESLFAPPGDHDSGASALSRIGAAAADARLIAGRTADLSGATVAGHADFASASAEDLDHAFDADARLADSLRRGTELHGVGKARAGALRAAAGEVVPRIGPMADLPAGELAALKVLREHVAHMRDLLGEHRSAGARTAVEIRAVRYGQERRG